MPTFQARYSTTCANCGKPIEPGQFMNWNPRGETRKTHFDCDNPTRVPEGKDKKAVSAKPLPTPTDLASLISQLSKLVEASKPSAEPEPETDEITMEPEREDEPELKLPPKKAPASKKPRDNAHWYELLASIVEWANREKQYIRILLIGPPGTGKSTTSLLLAGIKKENRITFTEGMGVEDAIGMFQLIKGETIFQPVKITSAMDSGEPMLWDEVDHHPQEISSGMYGWLDDDPHVTLPTGETKTAKPGYAVFATTNSNVTALPEPILDRFDAVLSAIVPHPDAVARFKSQERKDAVLNYFKGLDATPWTWAGKPTLRRMRAFEMLEPVIGEVNAATLAFGTAGKEILSILTTASRKP